MAETEQDLNAEMIIVALVPHEPAVRRHCPNCHKQFRAHEKVFVSLGEEVMIHVTCVIGLALIATVQSFVPSTTEAVYAGLRQSLIDGKVRMPAEAERTDG